MKVQSQELSLFGTKLKFSKNLKKKNAFTLIELLVVIAIIAVLLIALFMVFKNSINKARDAQRKRDIKRLKIALEDYYNDNDSYPPLEYIADCNGESMNPYLKQVPCDPTTGEPYLYLIYPGNGDSSQGYRILTRLDNMADPIIELVGCSLGCGMPTDHEKFEESASYVYGISEGMPLVYGDVFTPSSTPTASPTASPSPSGEIDAAYCAEHLCYCCSANLDENQDCNVWDPGQGVCGIGPYVTVAECYASTPCTKQ